MANLMTLDQMVDAIMALPTGGGGETTEAKTPFYTPFKPITKDVSVIPQTYFSGESHFKYPVKFSDEGGEAYYTNFIPFGAYDFKDITDTSLEIFDSTVAVLGNLGLKISGSEKAITLNIETSEATDNCYIIIGCNQATRTNRAWSVKVNNHDAISKARTVDGGGQYGSTGQSMMESIHLDAGNNTVVITFGSGYATTLNHVFFVTDKNIMKYTPSEILYVGKNGFRNNNYLKVEEMLNDTKDRILDIGSYAFYACGDGSSRTVENFSTANMFSVGSYAFYDTGITADTLTISANTKYINTHAFNMACNHLVVEGQPANWVKNFNASTDIQANNMTSMEFKEGVTDIPAYITSNTRTNVVDVYLPSTLQSVPKSNTFNNLNANCTFHVNMTRAEFEALNLEWQWASTTYNFEFAS